MIIFRIKQFTQWDDTDRLKAMKDSDILAEKKRGNSTARGMASGALTGAAVGLGAGVVTGALSGKGITGRAATAGRFGRNAAIGGAVIGAAAGYLKNRKEAKENRFYNQRLEYAQRQAIRREKKDWKTNMTQRDGYSY